MNPVLRPVFTLELNYKIIPGLVTLGKYDGTHPSLTAATSTDKVVKEIATLNINQKITALAAGVLVSNDEKDILVIGTNTHILVYHVHDNRDVFYRECQDGVRTLAIGTFNDVKMPVVMVGGNSSIQGYDHAGNEIFWTAVGDVVTSIILTDYNKDGLNEIIAGAEDFNIRVYKGHQTIAQYTETEVVTNLVALPENRFAYSVSNGTVGVYEQDVRLWRIKSKNIAISLHPYDLLGQSTVQLVIGWSNGKIDCRAVKTGEVLFKDAMSSGISGLVEGDYRSIGKADIICVSCEGEVRGYTTTKTLTNAADSSETEHDSVRELLAQKQILLMELKHYSTNAKYNENAMHETESYENSGVIPANTRLQIAINTNDSMKNNQ
ncbi:hypothetical protein NQ318_010005 [Aromia moschata]|uniref:Bardet-Biedl syndrome 2 protein homolog n=1 Tax=Aromia moschata TaxID=1265417 RepID=A0AAV8Y9D9_9CUCU|nr:hypothetical protein NQ318_010005 [Aromia moschata]